MTALPKPPVRLAYQPRDGYRHDVWRGRARVAVAVMACVVALAAAAGARSGLRKWQAYRAQVRLAWAQHGALLAWEALCMNHVAPPTQAVYSEPHGEVARMLRRPDCVPIRWVGPGAIRRRTGSPWDRGTYTAAPVSSAALLPDPVRRYPIDARGGVAFAGGRRSAGGTERLVVVLVVASDRPGARRVRWLDFTAHPFSAAGRRPGESPVPGTTTSLDVAILPGEYARVLAGQRDPNDPAREKARGQAE